MCFTWVVSLLLTAKIFHCKCTSHPYCQVDAIVVGVHAVYYRAGKGKVVSTMVEMGFLIEEVSSVIDRCDVGVYNLPAMSMTCILHSFSISRSRTRNLTVLQQGMEAVEDVVIVGAGLAGLATALGLHRKGIRSLVLESSETLRASGYANSTWTNAWKALDVLGVGESVRQHNLRLQRVTVSSFTSGAPTTELILTTQGKCAEHEVRSVRRNLLLQTLEKELPHGTIRYSSKLVSIEEAGELKLLHLADGSTLKTKALLGCDGVNSVVAKWLGLKNPSYFGCSASRGFTQFPDGHGFKPEIAIFIEQGFRIGLLPCDEKSVYWFFTAEEKEMEENTSKMKQYVLSKLRMQSNVPDEVVQVVEKSETNSMASSPFRFRQPFEMIWGNISKGNVCVAGDALHPMTPDLGQGGCSALEDGVVLARCLGEALLGGGTTGEQGRITDGLAKFAKERRWRSFELIAVSYVMGCIQQTDWPLKNFMRQRSKYFSTIMAKLYLKMADFDCGKL